MRLTMRACTVLIIAASVATSGCGVQDSEQPATGSISVKADKDDETLTTPTPPRQSRRGETQVSRRDGTSKPSLVRAPDCFFVRS